MISPLPSFPRKRESSDFTRTTWTPAFAGVTATSLDRFHRSCLLPEDELLDLARGGLRQHAEHHVARRLETREIGAAVLDELLFSDFDSRLHLDESARGLAPFRVGFRHHRSREHRRVPVERV